MAQPFRAIEGAIQGEKRGKSKRKEWGLIPPNQFGKNGIDSRGFRGGLALGFRGGREQAVREEEDDRRACGAREGEPAREAGAAGLSGLGREAAQAERRERRPGRERGGEGAGPGGEEAQEEEGEKERETLGWAWPKGGRGFIFRFFFLINFDNCFCCLIIISGVLKIQVKFEGSF
jgi:hypothetical protein